MSYGDAPSVYSCKMQTARKEHTCCECHRTIKIGERYQMFKGIWEGKADRFKTCKQCADLRDDLAKDARIEDYPVFGDLAEMASEAGIEFPPKEGTL